MRGPNIRYQEMWTKRGRSTDGRGRVGTRAGRWAAYTPLSTGNQLHSTPTKQSARRLSPLSLEPRRFLGAAGHVARAVRMRPGPGEVAAGDNQVLLANGAPVEPTFQDLAHPGRVARLG